MMFETERLIIRPIEDEDFKAIKRGEVSVDRMVAIADSSNEGMNRLDFTQAASIGPLIALTDDQVKSIVTDRKAGELPYYAICKKPSATGSDEVDGASSRDDALAPVIGIVGFNKEPFDFKNRVSELGIGFFSPEDRGQGYGKEVLHWTCQYAFDELNLHKLQLACFSSNEAAAALYRKVGFVEEGRLRKVKYMTGKWYDSIIFGLLEEEWAGQSATS